MLLSEKIRLCSRIPYFSQLEAHELFLIASAAESSSHGPGSLLIRAGSVPARLGIFVSGSLEAVSVDGSKKQYLCPLIPGLNNILLEEECSHNWYAAGDGCIELSIRRGQLLTIIYECPRLLSWIFRPQDTGIIERYLEDA